MVINIQTRRMLKWLGYPIAGILLLLLTLLIVLSFSYDKAIIKYLKKNLNDHLLTEIIVEDIDFSMIRRFPYATVEFTHVVIRSKAGPDYADFNIGDKDTLLSASRIYFQFGLSGLMKNEYKLKRVHLVDGKINLLTDKTGRDNYSIWKSLEKEKSESDSHYHIEFNNVIISSFDFCYINQKKPFAVKSFIRKLTFNGSFSEDAGSYALKSDLYLREAGKDGKVWVKNLPFSFDFKASSQHNDLTVQQGEIMLNKLLIQLRGHMLLDSSLKADLILASPNFGLDEIFSILSSYENGRLSDFVVEGKGKINSRIKGSLFAEGFPMIQADFMLLNGSIANKHTRSKLSGIGITGKFSGDKPSNFRFEISNLDARLSTGKIHGKANVTNLQHPAFSAELNSTINLNNLYNLIEFDTVEYLSGMVEAHLKAAGNLSKSEKLTVSGLLSTVQSGYFDFDDCAGKIKGLDYAMQDINGKILIDRNVTFQDLALNLNQTSFLVTGSVENIFNYLIDKKTIISSNLYIYSKFLDGKSFIRESQGSSQEASGFVFPDYLDIKAKINADEFQIGKFNATELKCDLVYTHKLMSINNFNFKFIDGIISGNSLITQAGDSCMLINCTTDLTRIDIQQFFTACNNFSQRFILDENLSGKLGGKVNFAACWDNRLNFMPSSLTAQAEVEIINGELLKFEPMLSLSKYISVEELKHIHFRTLKNTIYIYDQKIRIPEMLINSSAFMIALSGTHSFDNDFDYRLRVALSDVLFKKAKRKKKEIEEYMVMENEVDKTVIPISIIGNPDDFQVEFDSRKAFDLIKENLQQQGTDMKNIFGKGSLPYRENSGEKNNHPVIEWEDDPTTIPPPKETKSNHSGDEIQIKWEEEDSSDFEFFH